MYICNHCHETFNEPGIVYERHTEVDYLQIEEFAICPVCGGDDFGTAHVCGVCDEWAPESEMIDGMCEICASIIDG